MTVIPFRREPEPLSNMATDALEALSYLKLLDPNATAFQFQTFDDAGKRDALVKTPYGPFLSVLGQLDDLNARGAGVFMTINETDGRGRKDANIKRVRAVWCDFDDGMPADLPLRPSIIVRTSTSADGTERRQYLWLCDGLSIEEHRGVMAGMVMLGHDPKCSNVGRVLRLPGFYHRKGKPQLVEVIGGPEGGSGRRYTRDEILAAFPPVYSTTAEAPSGDAQEPPPGGWDQPGTIEDATVYLKAIPPAVRGQGGYRLTIEAIHRLRDFGLSANAACDALLGHWNDRCEPPWNDDHLRDTVAGLYRSAKQPPALQSPAIDFADVKAAPPTADAVTPPAQPAVFFKQSAAKWIGKEPTPTEWVVDKLVPLGAVSLLVAAGGRGKSLLAQQLMTCVATGTPFLGLDVAKGKACGMFCEDDDGELHRRQIGVCAKLGVDLADVADAMYPTSFIDAPTVLWTAGKGEQPLMKAAEAEIAQRPETRLWVVDGASFTFNGPEIDRGEVTRFLARLNRIAHRHRIAILLLTHESKSNQAGSDTHAASGSTAWLNGVRSAFSLHSDGDATTVRTLRHIKSNRGAKINPLPCRIEGGAFEVMGDPARQGACTDFAATLMGDLIDKGETLSPNSQASNFAGRVLQRHQTGSDFTLDEIKTSINLLTDFAFVVKGYTSKGKPCEKFVRNGDSGS